MTIKTLILAAFACSLTGCVLSSKTSTETGSLNYQHVSYRYAHPTPINNGDRAGAGVPCPQGYKVSGGGFDIDTTELVVESSGPSGDTAFLVAVRNISGAPLAPNFEVTAICIRLT